MRLPSVSSGEPQDPGVFRSSTFRLALASGLLVWMLMLVALGLSRWVEAGVWKEADLLREVTWTVHEVLQEISWLDAELRGPGDDRGGGQEDAAEGPEADREEEPGSGAPFEPARWTRKRLAAALDEDEWIRPWLEERELCWHLLGADGTWLQGNLSSTAASEARSRPAGAGAPGVFLRVTGVEVDPDADPDEQAVERLAWDLAPADERLHCWVQEVRLGDGSRFRLGLPFQPFHFQPALAGTLFLVLLGLAAAVGGAYLVARRTVRFVGDLRRARSRLEGESFPRLRQPGDAGDFDRAAGEINAILDALDSALGSLTHVTDNIAHDLRTPLTRLQGQLDILRRSGEPSEAMIRAVQEEADQLLTTFNALLRIAQVESGHRKRGFRSFDLARVVADLGELYAPAFAERGMPFNCLVAEDPVPATGDPDLWMQALSNLLDNALKYGPEGEAVDFELRAGRQPRLTLRDRGPGIPEGERDRVFERFYRVEQHRGQARSAGLGLSLVAAVCALHGATIELRGDEGLLVVVTWPPSS